MRNKTRPDGIDWAFLFMLVLITVILLLADNKSEKQAITITDLKAEQAYQREVTDKTANEQSEEVKQLKRIIWLMSDKDDIMLQIELGCVNCHNEYIEG